jgi:hypothetical protein
MEEGSRWTRKGKLNDGIFTNEGITLSEDIDPNLELVERTKEHDGIR